MFRSLNRQARLIALALNPIDRHDRGHPGFIDMLLLALTHAHAPNGTENQSNAN